VRKDDTFTKSCEASKASTFVPVKQVIDVRCAAGASGVRKDNAFARGLRRCSVYLLYWYKSTNTVAAHARKDNAFAREASAKVGYQGGLG
jgi:hypothetical protein